MLICRVISLRLGRCQAGRVLWHRDMGAGRSKSWYRARKTRAVGLSGGGWVAEVAGSGSVNGVLLCGAVP